MPSIPPPFGVDIVIWDEDWMILNETRGIPEIVIKSNGVGYGYRIIKYIYISLLIEYVRSTKPLLIIPLRTSIELGISRSVVWCVVIISEDDNTTDSMIVLWMSFITSAWKSAVSYVQFCILCVCVCVCLALYRLHMNQINVWHILSNWIETRRPCPHSAHVLETSLSVTRWQTANLNWAKRSPVTKVINKCIFVVGWWKVHSVNEVIWRDFIAVDIFSYNMRHKPNITALIVKARITSQLTFQQRR